MQRSNKTDAFIGHFESDDDFGVELKKIPTVVKPVVHKPLSELTPSQITHEVTSILNKRFRAAIHYPADITAAFEKLKISLIIHKQVELADIALLADDIEKALLDRTQTKTIIQLINVFLDKRDFAAFKTELNKKDGVCQKSFAFFKANEAKIADLTNTFAQKIDDKIGMAVSPRSQKLVSKEWNKKLEDIVNKQYKEHDDEKNQLHVFIINMLGHLQNIWKMQTETLTHSSEYFAKKKVKMDTCFQAISMDFERLFMLMNDLLSIRVENDAERKLKFGVIEQLVTNIKDYPEKSVKRITEYAISDLVDFARATGFDLDSKFNTQILALQRKYHKTEKSSESRLRKMV